ncbi:MAG TPA: phosphoribosylanthranilate isomerase [Candidatus Acidoferrales bacterium]|nr:phosphoribosylanthranilate isomerase [Candidatus Acidoferrales bacterium]
MEHVKIKICGITNWPDARRACEAGADFLGFNFFAGSPRCISVRKARAIVRRLPKRVAAVGVFVNESPCAISEIAEAVGLHYVQLHGEESPAEISRLGRSIPVIKAIRVRSSVPAALSASRLRPFESASAFLLDGFEPGNRGGTGKTFDWSLAAAVRRRAVRIFLAGGLTPANVADAIRAARPYAVDVCSGVEVSLGKKDPAKLEAFARAVRDARRAPARRVARVASAPRARKKAMAKR